MAYVNGFTSDGIYSPIERGHRRPFDPGAEHMISAQTQHGKCDVTLFEGRSGTGKVKGVLLRGEWRKPYPRT